MGLLRYFIVFSWAVFLAGIALAGHKPVPLYEDDWRNVRKGTAECVFDKQIRELGAVWTPDLGPPIGVLYCMRCTCVPYHKKKRIVARVQCHSIKNQCPVPTCDDPVVLPGRCCKTCPGDISPDTVQDIVPQNVAEVEEKNGKHYAALLTGRSSLVLKNEFVKPIGDLNKNNVVATGRFSMHKRNLYYSFYISENAARPQSLQFIDNQGNILEEFTLSHAGGYVNSLYQNASRKVCGVWRRLAKDYRKLLKQEKMYAVLVWGTKDPAEFTLSGLITKNSALQTELLSALLEPSPGCDSNSMAGAGGTAIVSLSTTVTPSINVAIMFNGLFMPSELENVPINITLSMDDRRQVVLQEIAKVTKPAIDVNVVNVSATITQAHLRYLTRGRVLLSVSSVTKPEALRLSGNIITKASCEIFQSTLSSSNGANPDSVSGMAWLYLNNAGSLIYNIQIDKLPPKENPPMITLIDTGSKKKTELESLIPYFHGDGWANGTLDKLTPRVLEPLYAGDLAINVATTSDNSLIKGKLTAKPVDEARDAPAPVLLKREYSNLSTATVGLAWISVDNECHLHYDVSITGIGDRKMELWMEMYPFIAPGAPFINKELESFQGNSVEGSPVEVLSREELIKLETGVNFLKVKDASTKVVLLMATVTKVSIPPPCRPYTTSPDNSIPDLYDHPQVVSTGECFFEEKFYKNEEIWVSSKNACQMCFCQNGAAKCDFMTCPEVNCTDGKMITVEGECCSVCVNNSIPPRDQKCSWNGKSYLPSVKFHPFLIPTGFDLCTECYCDPSDLQIKCSRLDDNEKLCCNKNNCNNKFNINDPLSDDFISPDIPDYSVKHQGSEYSKKKENFAAKILEEGGCKNPSNPKKPFANGTEYHPYIDSLGEYKCVTCKCQNGTPNCSRQHCDAQTCKKIQDIKRRKEKFNQSDFCCSPKDCRKLRHKKKHTS
ncbi:dorsal-ventral patterning protein Sog isoform X2 [Anthonomus grandis grandis]|uniref:dorsal-ventral patterning protein Sog isoform X2 n=1 Tax=Anthonomus grandis grandis TaxID=2921223 RepID=UPI00216651A8|nr:dorsal-ventral patterning protein Sog isoform X2 [Anthonomus grandis grandis]